MTAKRAPAVREANGRVIVEVTENRGRPPEYHVAEAATGAERKARHDEKQHVLKLERIAVLDMESDPFDKDEQNAIFPFAACLYSDQFEPVVIWEEDFDTFVDKVLAAIEALDGYTIYAHNGGKFDYMFLIHKIRGQILFKGRGIMSAKVGTNELRDSFHIIPERLAGYHKEKFDYQKMRRDKREAHRDEIIRYLVSDCEYLFEIVRGFLARFGFKISIGQAAMSQLKQHYKVERISKMADATLREFYYGGRVECLRGAGHWKGPYKLYDRNSMYPAEMAYTPHPIGSNYTKKVGVGITPATCFVELTCYSHGALVRKNDNNETSAPYEYGRYKTTIHEYNMAMALGLLERVQIHSVIECDKFSTFENFIFPLYEEKARHKEKLDQLKAAGLDDTPEYWDTKQHYTFSKLILNNAYGKFAQNPAKYKEHCITGPDDPAPDGFEGSALPAFRCDQYSIWERPNPNSTFFNVGTAASITGASRADLLRVIYNATDPLYCDTDSVICRAIDETQVEIHPSKLGAWDLEAEFSEVIIVGKKLYACKPKNFEVGQEGKIKVKSKGATGLSWQDMMALLRDETIQSVNPAPTMTRYGGQFYMRRNIRRTTPHAHTLPHRERRTA